MPKISLIIPVYNAERYLAETLDSLLDQTHHDLELVCVNDGSHDNSWEILQRYVAQDSRVVPIDQPNQGVSVARNTGIARATGDIIMFVDADDKLVPTACAVVAGVFEDPDVEVFTFGFECFPQEATPLGMEKELKPPRKVYEPFSPSLLFEDKARPYPWRTALRHSFVEREHIHFEPGVTLGEDQIIYFAIYPFAKKTVLSPEQLYRYRMADTSATHTTAEGEESRLKRLEQHLAVIEAILRLWSEKGMNGFCASELLEWCMDFVVFDINALPEPTKRELFTRLLNDFDSYFTDKPEHIAKHPSATWCLTDIRSALQSEARDQTYVSLIHLSFFYRMRYGFIRCFQQVLIGMGILKKWK